MNAAFVNICFCVNGRFADMCRANRRAEGIAWLIAEGERREIAAQTGAEREAAWELYAEAGALSRTVERCLSAL